MSRASSSANPPSSSLSSVVSGLVRAQMGTSLAPTVTDDDLDKHVAELILKEAKKKAETYKQHGVHALVSNRDYTEPNAPRANKRFLTSIIKSTDDHNKTVLRAQAQAAQDAKLQRIQQEKEERRRRAEEAVAARKKDMYRPESSSRRDRERDGSRSRRERERDGGRDRRDDDRRTGSARDKGKGREYDREEGSSRRRERERDESRSKRARDRTRSRSPSKSRTERHADANAGASGSRPKTDDTEGWDRWDAVHARRTGEKRRQVRDWATWNGEADDDDLDGARRRRSRSPGKQGEWKRRTRSPSASSRNVRSPSPPTRSRRPALDDLGEADTDRMEGERETDGTRGRNADLLRLPASKRGRSTSPVDSTPTKRTKHTPSKHKRRRRSPSCAHPPPYRSPSPSSSPTSRSQSVTPGPLPAPPSKMDKYFADTYDPRLDVAPLSAPSVPSTGLVSNAEFEPWDAMLTLVKQRQADREERKMLERMGIVSSKDKVKKKKKGVEDAGKGTKEAAARWGEEVSIMDMEYAKKGSVREWDLGKETPT